MPGHEIPNPCETLLWVPTKWANEYARGNLSEASFSLDEYHYGHSKDAIRVRAHTLDPDYYSAPDPAVFTAAVARVLTPTLTTRPRTAAPTGS